MSRIYMYIHTYTHTGTYIYIHTVYIIYIYIYNIYIYIYLQIHLCIHLSMHLYRAEFENPPAIGKVMGITETISTCDGRLWEPPKQFTDVNWGDCGNRPRMFKICLGQLWEPPIKKLNHPNIFKIYMGKIVGSIPGCGEGLGNHRNMLTCDACGNCLDLSEWILLS